MTKHSGRFSRLETAPSRGNVDGPAPARDVNHYMNKALKLELGGEHEKALAAYSDALVNEPLHITAWARQLWMLLYLDEAIEAAAWADKALRHFPNDPDILALKSLAQWRNGMVDEAQRLNAAAMSSSRDCANVWLARGEIGLTLEPAMASACFRHAQLAPGVAGLTEIRAGDILLRHERFDESAAFFRRAVVKFPQSSWAWYGFGRAQRALRNEDLAREAFGKACKFSPRDRRYARARKGRVGLMERFVGWIGGA